MTPHATYRVQFHKGFSFRDGAALAPYLARLGVSHLYASPILHARAGSMHGYDVVDHRRINPELGGEEGFRDMAAALRRVGLGIVLDIVPNHIAVGGADNPWWLDVLEKGAASPFAQYFDIDWSPPGAALRNKILAPFLGNPYADALAAGEISLIWDSTLGRLAFAYYDHRFPLRREDYADVCGSASPHDADLSRYRVPEVLHELLERQNFRLAWWRTASDQINWRRFFTINTLAALRVEEPAVFDAVHGKILDLYEEGLIDGVRIDHVDGLTDPGLYCLQLRKSLVARIAARPDQARHEMPYIVVEKILAADEALPRTWQIQGTTGYSFMNDVSALQHKRDAAPRLGQLWKRISKRSAEFVPEEVLARREILHSAFEAPLEAAARAAQALMPASIAAHDVSEPALRRGLVAIVGTFRAYRTYATGEDASPPAGAHFDAAVASARACVTPVDCAAVEYLAAVIGGRGYPPSPARERAVRLFNQLTAPVAAKAVEDTAFYRYGRLLSRNDVGFDATEFGVTAAVFHRRMAARCESFPLALSATATHDHKRGEDARARLAVLSEIAEDWEAVCSRWLMLNRPLQPQSVAVGDVYMLYQTLVCIWEGFARLDVMRDRATAWCVKSLREAKLLSSWADPDPMIERAYSDFIEAITDPLRNAAFLQSLDGFVRRIAPAGALNGLVQMALRCLCPGIPDCYQGTEYWDFSLVDPDNRRDVDYSARMASLYKAAELPALLATWQDGRVKQALLARLLALRKDDPALFEAGSYTPLMIEGEKAAHCVAFRRHSGNRAIVVAVPHLVGAACIEHGYPLPAQGFWRDTRVHAEGAFIDTFTGTAITSLACADLFAQMPIAVLLAA